MLFNSCDFISFLISEHVVHPQLALSSLNDFMMVSIFSWMSFEQVMEDGDLAFDIPVYFWLIVSGKF
jgi:hypothetical protein